MFNSIYHTVARAFMLSVLVILAGDSVQARAADYESMAYDAYQYSYSAEVDANQAYRRLFHHRSTDGYIYSAYANAANAQTYANDAYAAGAAIYSDYGYDAIYYADLAYNYALDAYQYASEGEYADALIFLSYASSYAYEATSYNYLVYLGY